MGTAIARRPRRILIRSKHCAKGNVAPKSVYSPKRVSFYGAIGSCCLRDAEYMPAPGHKTQRGFGNDIFPS
jgi:hypothetical protein